MSTILRTAALSVALIGALSAPTANAATATDTFTVSITVENSCTIAVNDLNFGTVNTLATAVNGSTTGTVTCTGIGAYSIAFNAGTGTGSTLATRKLANGADTIDYNLYSAANGGGSILGDGTGGTATIGGTSTGAADSFTVYGQVAGGQNPKPTGTYTSDVVATVTF